MMHLDEGRLRTLLDGELGDDAEHSARAHLHQCDACEALFEELESASVLVGLALQHLDVVGVPAGAKASVMARLDSGAKEPKIPFRVTFARAAIFVVAFGAVVATALPASPVQGWLGAGWDRAVALFGGTNENTVLPVESVVSVQKPEPAVVRLEVGGTELTVFLEDIPSGTELEIGLIDGSQAAAYAAEPARFRTSDGRIVVTGGTGLVRIDIPRSVDVASVRVNGRIYVQMAGERLDTALPVLTQSPDQVRLRVQ